MEREQHDNWCSLTYLKNFKEEIAFIAERLGFYFTFPKVDQIHPEIFHVPFICKDFAAFLCNSHFDQPTV